MPTVSVIVPNYNHAPYLRQRIESILAQTYQDFELILLDDCSTDGSRDILDSYRNDPHVSRLIYNETNSGSAFHQWKRGIELAQGEWIWIAESDDYADPAFLERMVEEATKAPLCVLAYAATWWVDEKGDRLWEAKYSNKVNVYHGQDFIRKKLAVCNSIVNVSECIFRRDCYRPAESYRYEHMRLCGDWLFYVLLAEQGSVVEVEEPLSYYRQHSSNISSEAETQGLTFLEGADILEYMTQQCRLRTSDYARGWGHMWAKYERQYSFTPEVKKAVRRRIACQYPIIQLYHLGYSVLQRTKTFRTPSPNPAGITH